MIAQLPCWLLTQEPSLEPACLSTLRLTCLTLEGTSCFRVPPPPQPGVIEWVIASPVLSDWCSPASGHVGGLGGRVDGHTYGGCLFLVPWVVSRTSFL